MTAIDTKHGATQTNGLEDPTSYYAQEFAHMTLREFAKRGGRITRVRFLTERVRPGANGRLFDLSYVHGVLPDGQMVRVTSPFPNLTPALEVKGELIRWAKEEGVFAKALGLLDEANWSVMYG